MLPRHSAATTVTNEYDPLKDCYINKTAHGWGCYQADGNVGHNGSAKVRYTEAFKEADTLVDGSLLEMR